MNAKRGFTLIELLIVVAIIAILAAIAVPNFLEAQTRSKVSRCKADMRSIATALEAYYVDANNYIPAWSQQSDTRPPHSQGYVPMPNPGPGQPLTGWNLNRDFFVRWRLVALTSPIAYLSSLPMTPFSIKYYKEGSLEEHPVDHNAGFNYDRLSNYGAPWAIQAGAIPKATKWFLRDGGPDGRWFNSTVAYDPSNGTVSEGEIWRFGP